MEDMLARLRAVFLDSGESQTSIAKKTNVTSAYIWKILNNDSVRPRDLFIDSVCREFNVNEDWLRTGTGEMHKPIEDRLSAYVSEITDGDDYFIQDLITVYMELDDASKKALRKLADGMARLHNKRDQN